jgi:hypothetical protein
MRKNLILQLGFHQTIENFRFEQSKSYFFILSFYKFFIDFFLLTRLNAGWSSKTNIISNTKNMIVEHLNGSVASNQTQISDNEYYEIEKVIQRAAMIEQKEISRITRLYQRYNTMNKPQGYFSSFKLRFVYFF